MKITIFWISFVASAFSEPVKTESNQALALVIKQNNPTPVESIANGTLPATPEEIQPIFTRSQILHDGTNWTLIPKRAVLFIPEKSVAYLGARPVGRLLEWGVFLAKNSTWLAVHETSYHQAAGRDPIPAETIKAWKKQNHIIVAVHQGEPISVSR